MKIESTDLKFEIHKATKHIFAETFLLRHIASGVAHMYHHKSDFFILYISYLQFKQQ